MYGNQHDNGDPVCRQGGMSAEFGNEVEQLMSLWSRFRARIRREHFAPTWLGVLTNPAHIVRSGLYKAIKEIAPEIQGNILDFGCGSKPYEHLFLNSASYVGCDTQNSGHDHYTSKVDYFYDGKTLPFADEQFDAVVSFEVFEHIFDLPNSIKEINRVTKRNGLLLISIPFAWAEHEAPHDFARYTTYGISYLLEKNGYKVVNLKRTSTYLLAVFQLLLAYLIQVAPKNKLYYLFQLGIFFPTTLAAYTLNAVLPAKNELFLGSVILARKVTQLDNEMIVRDDNV